MTILFDLRWGSYLLRFCYWEMMCMLPSQCRNAVVQPARKKIANKKFCSRSWVMLPCASPKGACALLNWWLMTPPTPPTFLFTKEGRGAVIGTPATQAASVWGLRVCCRGVLPITKPRSLLPSGGWKAMVGKPIFTLTPTPTLSQPRGGVPPSWVIRMQLSV